MKQAGLSPGSQDVRIDSPAEAHITHRREIAVEVGSHKSAITGPYRRYIGVEDDRRAMEKTQGVAANGKERKETREKSH